ncbi:hypothetical protein C8P63_1563 [Melghirimyces profundicolus]|uniref:Uncharacterized protein n=1 Tax=Melghirimyces profundicolus TaxID=1242148 RepID=A0A2T6ASS3_9BACL|nr:hypothetical protein C8P63_1563 [Melghirimyces profundicolus]
MTDFGKDLYYLNQGRRRPISPTEKSNPWIGAGIPPQAKIESKRTRRVQHEKSWGTAEEPGTNATS